MNTRHEQSVCWYRKPSCLQNINNDDLVDVSRVRAPSSYLLRSSLVVKHVIVTHRTAGQPYAFGQRLRSRCQRWLTFMFSLTFSCCPCQMVRLSFPLYYFPPMTHASVFSGIGGPEVAATMLGWDNLFHCEINPFGRQVLDYWYPNSKSYEDITTTDFTEWRGRVDVLTGGFPCQPFSYAGRRRGAEDDRYLWPSMYRAIDEIQPTWVVAENVAGILTMVEQGEVSKVAGTATLFDAFDDLRGRYELRETFTLQRICSDLESHGYAVQPVLVPACAVGAPHRRDRVFIVARRVTADTDYDGSHRRKGNYGKARQDCANTERHATSNGERDGLFGKSRTPGSAKDAADTYMSRLERIGRPERNTDGTQGETRAWDGVSRNGENRPTADTQEQPSEWMRPEQSEVSGTESQESGRGDCQDSDAAPAAYDMHERLQRWLNGDSEGQREPADRYIGLMHCGVGVAGEGRWQAFPSVSPVHRGNDGLPFDVDRLTLSFGKWRTEALKAYGNAIVPQVMYELFRAIEQVESEGSL